jgi:hypothetical protein
MGSIKDIKTLYTSYLTMQKKKNLVGKYKAGKETARFVWLVKVRPAVDKFLDPEGKEK